MSTHTGRIRTPTGVGDPLRAVQVINRVVAGARWPAIPWSVVEERCVQMDVGHAGRREFWDWMWARKKRDEIVWRVVGTKLPSRLGAAAAAWYLLLGSPAEVGEQDVCMFKDWARSSCRGTGVILAFCGEREHEVSVTIWPEFKALYN